MKDADIATLRKRIVQIVALKICDVPEESQFDAMTSAIIETVNASIRPNHLSDEDISNLMSDATGPIGNEVVGVLDAMQRAAGGQTGKA